MAALNPADAVADTRSRNPLPAWQRRWLHGCLWAALTSGMTWITLHYMIGPGPEGLPLPAESWVMKLHGISAFAALFGAGLVGGGHVARGWRSGLQRNSGLALCALGGLMVASGYAMYYLLPETWRTVVGLGHAALGLSLAGVLLWHTRER